MTNSIDIIDIIKEKVNIECDIKIDTEIIYTFSVNNTEISLYNEYIKIRDKDTLSEVIYDRKDFDKICEVIKCIDEGIC